jgi:hypothetical protein
MEHMKIITFCVFYLVALTFMGSIMTGGEMFSFPDFHWYLVLIGGVTAAAVASAATILGSSLAGALKVGLVGFAASFFGIIGFNLYNIWTGMGGGVPAELWTSNPELAAELAAEIGTAPTMPPWMFHIFITPFILLLLWALVVDVLRGG